MMQREKQKHGKEEDEINIIADGVAPQSTQKLQLADVKDGLDPTWKAFPPRGSCNVVNRWLSSEQCAASGVG